jgi:hypothetical protein
MEAIDSQDQTALSSTRRGALSHDQQCPVCGGDNECRMAKGHLYKGLCWCDEIIVPSQILRVLAGDRFDPACLCRRCLETAAKLPLGANDSVAVDEIRAMLASSQPVLKEEDYYLDENGNVVFTAAYHSNRGTCCGNGCRHCPY